MCVEQLFSAAILHWDYQLQYWRCSQVLNSHTADCVWRDRSPLASKTWEAYRSLFNSYRFLGVIFLTRKEIHEISFPKCLKDCLFLRNSINNCKVYYNRWLSWAYKEKNSTGLKGSISLGSNIKTMFLRKSSPVCVKSNNKHCLIKPNLFTEI